MKKYIWIFLIFIIALGIGYFVFQPSINQKSESNYIANKTSTNLDSGKNAEMNNMLTVEYQKGEEEEKQEELSAFSTKLPKDTKERYSNIKLACEALNGTIVKKGETFSLWNTLGCPTKEKGYRKAKTFTSNGGVTKSYGGGICQVSTTIYNAVLEIEELDIKERHEHSRDVVYIKDGRDAAVSYKSADFQFVNTLGYDIQMEAKLEDNQVKIKLIRI